MIKKVDDKWIWPDSKENGWPSYYKVYVFKPLRIDRIKKIIKKIKENKNEC